MELGQGSKGSILNLTELCGLSESLHLVKIKTFFLKNNNCLTEGSIQWTLKGHFDWTTTVSFVRTLLPTSYQGASLH